MAWRAARSSALATLVAGTAREAEATFPGQNGRIAFASDRTEGVDNPTKDCEIDQQRATGEAQIEPGQPFSPRRIEEYGG